MKKVSYLLVAILILTLSTSSSVFAQSNTVIENKSVESQSINPVEFSVDNGILAISKTAVNENSILEISPYN